MGKIVIVCVLITVLTGCASELMGDQWQAAHADGEAARAAAEWARTQQVQAETAAAAREATAREQARTITIIALFAVGVVVAAGCGAALMWWSVMRARLVFADKFGLYPVVAGQMAATNLNEPGAQQVRIAPTRAPYQVLPPPEELDALPMIPAPIELDARQLQHLERLLLPAPGSIEHDTN